MNCPYCNQICSPSKYEYENDFLIFICYHCTGKPQFLEWNDFGYYKSPAFVGRSFFTVGFFSEDLLYARFSPQTGILFVWNLDKDFQMDYLITPDNILETLERLNKLKAFL